LTPCRALDFLAIIPSQLPRPFSLISTPSPSPPHHPLISTSHSHLHIHQGIWLGLHGCYASWSLLLLPQSLSLLPLLLHRALFMVVWPSASWWWWRGPLPCRRVVLLLIIVLLSSSLFLSPPLHVVFLFSARHLFLPPPRFIALSPPRFLPLPPSRFPLFVLIVSSSSSSSFPPPPISPSSALFSPSSVASCHSLWCRP